MVNKGVILFASIIMISFGLIIVFPISILTIHLTQAGYDSIDKPLIYSYYSSNSSEIQALNLDIEVGDIEIKYIEPSVDYLVKVEVNIVMSGSNLAGKSYENFFDITPKLENIDSTINFTLEITSDDWFDPSLWPNKNVSTVVYIRKDVVLDIFLLLDDGDFKITVPYGVSIGNLRSKLSKGNILYEFQYCIIEGNITGITYEGDLELKSYNVTYTQNSNWMLNCTGGYMGILISQYKEMGANITGTAIITNSELGLFYKDNTTNIGALFTFPLYSRDPPAYFLEGFKPIFQGVGLSYVSSDFPTINNYNLSINLTETCFGCLSIELYSK
jgi:hypothetical protein